MKEDLDELSNLFDQGQSKLKQIEVLYDELVPYRSYDPSPVPKFKYEYTSSFQVKAMAYYDAPEPESPEIKKLLGLSTDYVNEWRNKIHIILKRLDKKRYLIQFYYPNENANSIDLGRTTENEDRLAEVINNLDSHLDELRKIIIDLDSSLEKNYKSNADIEPATYDPQTRTIFFADEAIRFNKNAEYSPAICKLMFETPDKLWQLKDFQSVWDSLYDYLNIAKPTDWNRVYDAIKKINTRIEKATGIPNLFKLTTKSVRLNPKFVAPTKK